MKVFKFHYVFTLLSKYIISKSNLKIANTIDEKHETYYWRIRAFV